jgi:hypothetical protein
MAVGMIERVRGALGKAHKSAMGQYRKWLAAGDKGDEKGLLKVAQELGKRPEDIARDAEVMQEVTRLEALADGLPDAQKAFNAANGKANEYVEAQKAELDRMYQLLYHNGGDAEGRRLRLLADQAEERLTASQNASNNLAALREQHWQLFELPQPGSGTYVDGRFRSTTDPNERPSIGMRNLRSVEGLLLRDPPPHPTITPAAGSAPADFANPQANPLADDQDPNGIWADQASNPLTEP